MFKKLFDFFVFTSLYIAFCAVLMVYQTTLIFHIILPFHLAGFVFFGSICSYNFHWFLTQPNISNPSAKAVWNINYKLVHFYLFIIGLIGSVVFTFLLWHHWIWLVLTAILTFLYSAPKIPLPFFIKLRKVAVGKTLFLTFAWTHITVLLPILLTNTPISSSHIWFALNRFFFIYGICIIFDRRDVEEDRRSGIKSIITYLSQKGIDRLFWFNLFLFTISLIFLAAYVPYSVIISLIIPCIIMALLYVPSKNKSSDYLYYFVLDGLVMISAPILILLQKIIQ